MRALPDLSPADVGRRVSLRAVGADGSFDTVGRLLHIGGGRVVVERADGERRALGWPPAADPTLPPVVLGRVVPPDVAALDLQRIAQAGWPPEQVEPLGEWELRWTGGVTQRANSARAGGSPGISLADALVRTVEWYRSRGGTPTLQVPRPCHAEALREAGWEVTRSIRILVAGADELARPASRSGVSIDVGPTLPEPLWLDLLEERGDRAVLAGILTRPTTVAFASASEDGERVGIGRASATGGWCGITCIGTRPEWRRRGIAADLTRALARWAVEVGVTRCYLQVLDTNEGALALYESLGFEPHHDYDYWQPPDRADWPSARG